MSAAKDRPQSKPPTDNYRDNYDRIFGKKDTQEQPIKKEIENDDIAHTLPGRVPRTD